MARTSYIRLDDDDDDGIYNTDETLVTETLETVLIK